MRYSFDKFSSRNEEVRATIPEEGAIHLIENVYKAQYDLHCGTNGCFDAWDQLLACESVAESMPIFKKISPFQEYEYSSREIRENNQNKVDSENVYVNGNINDGCKLKINFELTESKLQIIERLKRCDYQTSPKEIAGYLGDFFKEYESKPGHWLYISQHWNPRAINRTLSTLIKLHESGRITIQNWAGYFVYLIKKRKLRRSL